MTDSPQAAALNATVPPTKVASMSEPAIRHVEMPPSDEYPEGHKLPLKDRVLVVIGANGSGKTRFGAWLDAQSVTLHHRVSAPVAQVPRQSATDRS